MDLDEQLVTVDSMQVSENPCVYIYRRIYLKKNVVPSMYIDSVSIALVYETAVFFITGEDL